MSIIKCPECNERVSNKAVSCPHCGCPQSEFKDIKPTLLRPKGNSMNICPKCGDISSGYYKCGYCNTQMINLDESESEILMASSYTFVRSDWEKQQLEIIKKNPMFDFNCYENRINNKISPQHLPEDKIPDEEYHPIFPNVKCKNYNINNLNIPKCPTCGSTHINTISRTRKIFYGLFLGIYTRKTRNSFECDNCGYIW